LAATAVACQPAAPASPNAAAAPGTSPAVAPLSPAELHRQALQRDPEPTDEALRDLLSELKDRFRCNAISGCSVHQRIVQYGWAARPYLETLFSKAGWQAAYRARTAQIVAELADPLAEPFLVRLLEDRDPEARAHAAVGLARLGAVQHRQRLEELRHADQLWQAPARLGALFALWRLGDSTAGSEFSAALAALAPLHSAGPALTLGADLCRQPDAPDCSAALPLIAHHPGFQPRRAALHAMTSRLRPSFAPALVYLLGDQARSIRDEAEGALVALTGDHQRSGRQAWQEWCSAGGCAALTGPQQR
jgi:hypothetical protein